MNRLILLATLGLTACATTQPTPETAETTMVDGKPAYVVSAGGSISDSEAIDRRLKGTSTPADIDRIVNGTHRSALPARAASLCPSGYDILSHTPPRARPEGFDVWSASAKFTLRCK